MKRLDKVGMDYLILMAKDIGFKAICVDTKESESCAPQATITFEQTREIATTPSLPAMSPPVYSTQIHGPRISEGTLTGLDIRGAQIPPAIFKTLDDDPEDQTPPCSTSKS